jgi:hypothetical protein
MNHMMPHVFSLQLIYNYEMRQGDGAKLDFFSVCLLLVLQCLRNFLLLSLQSRPEIC